MIDLNQYYPVFATGHRPNKLGGYRPNPIQDYVRSELRKFLLETRSEHPNILAISGMALGVDQIYVEEALELGIPYLAAIPCLDQAHMWPQTSIDHYEYLLNLATEQIIINPVPYHKGLPLKRNEWMVDHSREGVAVWNGDFSGGTAHCVRYAKKQGVPLTRINPAI